jgi:hypothetical protein
MAAGHPRCEIWLVSKSEQAPRCWLWSAATEAAAIPWFPFKTQMASVPRPRAGAVS